MFYRLLLEEFTFVFFFDYKKCVNGIENVKLDYEFLMEEIKNYYY